MTDDGGDDDDVCVSVPNEAILIVSFILMKMFECLFPNQHFYKTKSN